MSPVDDPDLPGPEDAPERPRESRRTYEWDLAVAVALGGALGGGARETLNLLIPTPPGTFPWSTFIENVSGCLLIGALLVYLLEVRTPTRYARPFLATGVLGGYTTFSSYSAQVRELLMDGRTATALTYAAGTLLAALAATWVGKTIIRLIANTHGTRRPA